MKFLNVVGFLLLCAYGILLLDICQDPLATGDRLVEMGVMK